MVTIKRHSPEIRDSAVRMVMDHQGEHQSQWAAIQSVGLRLGLSAGTLRRWIRQAEIDGGKRDGVTTAEHERIGQLEREVRELRRANEILKDAPRTFVHQFPFPFDF